APRSALPSFPTRRSSDLGPESVPDLHGPGGLDVELEPELPHVRDPLDERPGGADPDESRGKVWDPVVRDVVIGHGGEGVAGMWRSEEHTSELQSRFDIVC